MKTPKQFFVLSIALVIIGLSNPLVATAQQADIATVTFKPNEKSDSWKRQFSKKKAESVKNESLGVFNSPSFPGLARYLDANLIYPHSALENCIDGTVYARVEISATGEVVSVETVKGLFSACDNAVVKVLSEMPRWKPATWNGKPHDYKLIVPVKFHINK